MFQDAHNQKRNTGFEKLLLHPMVHAVADALRLVGLRDRYRCPRCRAVGTFKPHGGLFDRDDHRHVPRWLCKWCGYYLGPEGRMFCVIDPVLNVWREPEAVPFGMTPQEAVDERLGSTWPWRG